MNDSSWEPRERDTDKYLYDIRAGIEKLRRTVSGVGMIIIIILVTLTWFT
jgi:hypothetical protein